MRRTGRLTLVRPFPPELKKLLTFKLTPAQYDVKRGDLEFETDIQEMFAPDPGGEEGRWVFPAGFTFRVCKFLDAAGYEIDYKDIRNLNLSQPDFSRLTVDLRSWQKDAIACVLACPGGLVDAATATGKTIVIEQLCRIFPEETIVLTTTKTAPAVSVYKNLKSDPSISREVEGLGVIGKGSAGRSKRITVCHLRSLTNAPIDKCSLLLCDEVHGAAAPVSSQDLSKVSYANMYGFSASVEGRMDNAEPVLEGLFGPLIYRKSHEEAVEENLVSPVDAHIYRIKGRPIQAESFRERNRYGIIRNDRRNREIARVVQENYADRKVLIIAQDNLEHVFRLRQLLPGFVPVYGAESMKRRYKWLKGKGLLPPEYKCLKPGGHLAVAELFRQDEVRKVISTSVWDTGIDLPDLEVLVRADARTGQIPAIQLPGRVTRYKTEGGILVDFIDDFGPALAGRSRRRIQLYREIGYSIKHM